MSDGTKIGATYAQLLGGSGATYAELLGSP